MEHVPIPSCLKLSKNTKNEFVDPAPPFTSRCLAPHVTPRPDASVRVSQGSDIFCQGCAAPKVRACLQTSSLCAAACPDHFRFYFSGQPAPFLVSLIVGGEKENTRQCFASKNHDLAGCASYFKTTFNHVSSFAAFRYFLSDLSYKS